MLGAGKLAQHLPGASRPNRLHQAHRRKRRRQRRPALLVRKLTMQNQNVLESQAHRLATPKPALREPFQSWAGCRSPYPQHLSVSQAFEEIVEQFPDRIALSLRNEHLTYSDLNSRANRLAWRLRDCGVGPDSLVALCVERSIEMIVGILAILKAGGAYVPVDPSLPDDR